MRNTHGDVVRVPASTSRRLLAIVAALASLATVLGLATVLDPARAAPAPQAVAADPPGPGDDFARLPEACYREPYSLISPCRVTRFPGRPWLVVWGDSHALMYLSPIRFRAVRERVNLVVLTAGSCPVARIWERGVPRQQGYCERHNEESFAYLADLARRHDRVGLIANSFWAGYRRTWDQLVREQQTGQPAGVSEHRARLAYLAVKGSVAMFKAIGRLGVPTDVIAQAGTVPAGAPRCAGGESPYQCDLPRRRAMLRAEADNDRWLAERVRLLPAGARVLDPSPVYCSATTCRARVRGVDTWYDAIHVGERVSRLMRPYFRPTFRRLLR